MPQPWRFSRTCPNRRRSEAAICCGQALGCLLYYLLFSKLAFNPEAKLQILNGEFTVAGNRPPAMVALLRELLVVSPARRPGKASLPRLQAVHGPRLVSFARSSVIWVQILGHVHATTPARLPVANSRAISYKQVRDLQGTQPRSTSNNQQHLWT